MLAFMENLRGLELLFACCAVFGTTLFIIRLVLMFIGMGGEGADSADAEHTDAGGMDAGGMGAGHADAGGMDADHGGSFHDSDLSFKALSLQGITAFFMMFGLVGWAVLRQGDYAAWIPILCGAAAGLATVWVMKKIFQFAGSLQSSGTMNLANAVGQEGTVYLTIRPGKSGKVQVTFQDRLSVLEAVAEGSEEIKTGQSIRVVRVSAGKLVVEKLKS
jgi:membrane protein implicated in regulation of membrane protease activity